MAVIRGYSRNGRKLSVAIFIPLSLLSLFLTVIYVDNWSDKAVAVGFLVLSLLLITPLWWVFYPLFFLGGGVLLISSGLCRRQYFTVVVGVILIVMAISVTREIMAARHTSRAG